MRRWLGRILFACLRSILLTSCLRATVLGILFHRRVKSIEQQLRVSAEAKIEEIRSTREWKEAALAKVLGPTFMHLERTERAFCRWEKKQLFLEMEVIGKSNRCVRDLLLDNAHLIPLDLLDHASDLIHHYDVWLEMFHEKRESENPDLNTKFIFTGPEGYGFPDASKTAFQNKFHEFRQELYGTTQQSLKLEDSR